MQTLTFRNLILLLVIFLTGCALPAPVNREATKTPSPPLSGTTMPTPSLTPTLTPAPPVFTPIPPFIAPTPASIVQRNARGFWMAFAGDIGYTQSAVGKIYGYDWYAIEMTGPNSVTVIWDNGLNCSRTEGIIIRNEIRLVAQDVETVFVIYNDKTATVTFRQGGKAWVKQLEKKRDDPAVVCL